MSNKYNSEFEEICSVGCGGFSTVFKVKSINNNKTYAIKKIPFKDEDKNETIKEINILSTLNSDFVVSYIDSWIEDNYYKGKFDPNSKQNVSSSNLLYSPYLPYILHIQMELCSMTLSKYIEQITQTDHINDEMYNNICDLFFQLVECVQYLHMLKPPIIHRDLKPENILLIDNENSYKVKLTDFGLSAYHEYVDQSHTKYIGTKSYRAPEVDTKYYDTKADIYSLGKIIESIFKFDDNNSDNKGFISQEYPKQLFQKCVSSSPIERPDCTQILKDKYLWNYQSLSSSLKVMHSESQFFDKIDEKIFCDCNKVATINEFEEIAIIMTNDKTLYSLRVSDHIDSTIQEPNIINKLLNEECESVACGLNHVLVLTKNKHVFSFGNNYFGQLGSGTYKTHNKPKIIEDLKLYRITAIKCGALNSLALSECGEVFAWGDGSYGQIGNSLNSKPNVPIKIDFFNSEKITSICCGHRHCLALTDSGSVYGWGSNQCGQLGIGNNSDQYSPIHITLPDNVSAIKVCCGFYHSLILTDNNEIYSFGFNAGGQLGNGNNEDQNKPVKARTRNKFIDIETAINENLSIGLSLDKAYYVWGTCKTSCYNIPKKTKFKSFYECIVNFSQNMAFHRNKNDLIFSISTTGNQSANFKILKQFIDENTSKIICLSFVKLKETKAILLKNDDTVQSIRLTHSIDSSPKDPVFVNELSNKRIKSIICGNSFVLCLTETSVVYSFGDNTSGQLGHGSQVHTYKPTIISQLNNKHIIEISCGHYHCLALSKSAKLFVWGSGQYGQIGNGDNVDQLTPIQLNSLNDYKINSISCGSQFCLALLSNGVLYGWGDNRYGQLGIGNNQNQNHPIAVENVNQTKIIKICCGHKHSLLLSENGDIYSIGSNKFGQLGIGTTEDKNIITKIDTTIKFIDIHTTLSGGISSGLSQSGKFYFWGKCSDQVITEPTQTNFSSFAEMEFYNNPHK